MKREIALCVLSAVCFACAALVAVLAPASATGVAGTLAVAGAGIVVFGVILPPM